MSEPNISGRAAIVGLGATEFSKNSGRTELRLAMEATLAALADAGIDPREAMQETERPFWDAPAHWFDRPGH